MSWLPWNARPQLDQIEDTLANVEYLANRLSATVNRIDRRTIQMSAQEQELNEALTGFFAQETANWQAVSDGLTRIEAKLGETPDAVDLSDEIAAIGAAAAASSEARAAFDARVDVDAPPVEPPPDA